MKPSQQAAKGKAGAPRRAARAWLTAALSTVLGLASACGLAVEDSGSNSNWLQSCVADADCSSGFSCECGQCTITCAAQAACAELAGCCVNADVTCGTTTGGLCVAPCGSDTECTAIRDDLRCVIGTCRVPTLVPVDEPLVLPPPLDLPPGEWVTRGTPASCDDGGVSVEAEGAAPWGSFALAETWVNYTTGSTRPEFMTVAFGGSWIQEPDFEGALIIGVSISKTPESGSQLASGDGMEVWVTRYRGEYSEQVEVQGTLTIDEYVPPTEPIENGAALTLRAQLDLTEEAWSLTLPFELFGLCSYDLTIR